MLHTRSFTCLISKLKSLNKGLLKAKEVQLKSMSGNITGDFALSQTEKGNLRLITNSKLDQINVRQLFYEFENFGQNHTPQTLAR